MSEHWFLHEALSRFCSPVPYEGALAVTTHCLYPSNGCVSVYVTGGPTGSVVSDNGRALHVLSEHNRAVSNPDRYLYRFCKPSGLKSQDGSILSPTVEANQLASAIMFVANASAAAARWGVDNLKVEERRNLREKLYELLIHEFPKEKVLREMKVAGLSNRQYRFDHVIELNRDKLLVVDAVLPDANSINAHAIAHMDVAQRQDQNIVQRIVYDQPEEWNSEDLNLLQMAAQLVPFSQLPSNLEKVAVH